MIKHQLLGLLFLLGGILSAYPSFSAVKLPSFFSDNMVLQQNSKVAIWGTAQGNKTVIVRTYWDNKSYTTQSKSNGEWKLEVSTPKYGGPYTITVAEENIITLKNVLIGEVWLCSGQSNMEMPLEGWGKINDYATEIAAADYPQIRLLQALHVTANQPQDSLAVRNAGWDVCSPQTVADFSSVAYFFAREIYRQTKIPIGLIHSSWGGTVAEAWTSYETLSGMQDFAAAAKEIRNTQPFNGSDLDSATRRWEENALKKDAGFANGLPVWNTNAVDMTGWKNIALPGYWEENGLNNFDGVVWYRKKIILPAEATGQDAVLRFYADDKDVTWFNGEKIGATNQWDQLRAYTIPARLLKKGENYITVRVEDNGGNGGIYKKEAPLSLQTASGEHISLEGEWAYRIGYSLKDLPAHPAGIWDPNRATVLYNAMINPLINFKIRGAIWYQGESNASRAAQYRSLFPALINDWRSKFPAGDFPFYFVQLANFMQRKDAPAPSQWAALREAQLMTTSLPNTGMAVTIDIGDEKDIHPKNKQEVGRRLALIALNNLYNTKVEYSGPLYKSHAVKGGNIAVTFTHSKGLHAAGYKLLRGFAVAGKDKKFYWANARIAGDEVIVSAAEVPEPVAVRYGWADNPEVNLYNEAQLPVSPFRTDTWEE